MDRLQIAIPDVFVSIKSLQKDITIIDNMETEDIAMISDIDDMSLNSVTEPYAFTEILLKKWKRVGGRPLQLIL